MRVIIDHETLGAKTEFASLEDALKAVHDCGEDFAAVTLTRRGDDVIDDRGRVVGSVIA